MTNWIHEAQTFKRERWANAETIAHPYKFQLHLSKKNFKLVLENMKQESMQEQVLHNKLLAKADFLKHLIS